jgi:amphi-Trp domain-containing protein
MDKEDLFEHVSLQDRKSIKKYLKALTNGVGNGMLSLADNDGEITLSPDGLIRLNVSVRRVDHRHELHIVLDWKELDDNKASNPGTLVISAD